MPAATACCRMYKHACKIEAQLSSRALTLIRTELGRTYSLAGQQRMEQVAEVLPGLRKQWRHSGKLRARLTHDAIDGQLRDADNPFSAAGVLFLYPRDPSGPPRPSIAAASCSSGWRAGRSSTPGVNPSRRRRPHATRCAPSCESPWEWCRFVPCTSRKIPLRARNQRDSSQLNRQQMPTNPTITSGDRCWWAWRRVRLWKKSAPRSYDRMDAAIAKVVLRQTMTTDEGSSRAQARISTHIAGERV